MKLLRKISSFLLAILIIMATTGFKVEKFYCGSQLQSIHIFTSPTPCCSKTNTTEGKCRTEKEFVKTTINSDLPVVAKKIELPTTSIIFLTVFDIEYFSQLDLSLTKYLKYKPPLLLRDISVLFQSFLI